MLNNCVKKLTVCAGFAIGVSAIFLVGCGQGGDGETSESFPSRPLQIISPWAAGGATDTVSRITGEGLRQVLGKRVNVVNRTGGAGVTGHTAGARAKADGYTLTMVTVEVAMMHWRGLTDINPKDFEPIMLVNQVCAAIVVQQDAPWKNMKELQDAVRENPGKLTASGTAKGGIWHLACAAWTIAAGFPADHITWVPSQGAAPALQELSSGGVDIAFCAPAEAKTLIDAGKARLLAVLSDKPDASFPDVPTSNEQGVECEISGWAGIGVPSGTPPEICKRLESALIEVTSGEDFKTRMTNSGYQVNVEGAEGFRARLERDDVLFGRLLKDAGIVQ